MTPVTRVVATLAGSTLAAGLLVAAPASADGPADQVSGVVGGLFGPPAGEQQPARDRRDYGSTSAPSGRLRKGCHNYAYRYRVTPPTGDWTLETFLHDPTHQSIASGTFSSDSDPRAQRTHFRFCRYGTRPGRFTIRALVHWYSDDGTDHQIWLEPSHFRLRRPR